MAVFKGKELPNVLSRFFDIPDGPKLSVAREHGAYSRLDGRVFDKIQFEIIDLVKQSGIRGRGGAGFPTGMKWSFVPRNSGKPVYLVINADEGEPGTFKDRYLMEKDPHLLIEGMIIAGYALNVRTAYIFVRGEMLPQIRCLNEAIKEAYAAGLLGRNINGSKYSLDIYVHRGAGAYICGEETALINALEGYKGQPRLKPPFPAVSGAFQCPTVVNNVETIAAIPWIVEHGADAYRQWGTERSPGSKLFSISGDVGKPGVYEIPLAMPMMDFFELAGGIKGELAGCIPGGSSAPVLTAEECQEATMDYECMAAMKTMLGSGAVMPFNNTQDLVRLTETLARFYAHESCGQCTPCREGTGYAERILQQVVKGEAHEGDIDLIYDLADKFEWTTICPLATADAWAVKGFISKFREQFDAYQNKGSKVTEQRDVETLRPGAFW